MKSYLIGYDLNRPRGEDDYDDLIGEIRKLFGTRWHRLDSTWIVRTAMSAKQIRDALAPHIDSGDELLVVRLSRESAWKGFSSRAAKWLRDHL